MHQSKGLLNPHYKNYFFGGVILKKTVVITGASGGIGRALARAFAKEGYPLALNCRTSIEPLNAFCRELTAAYGISCLGLPADVGSSRDVSQMFHEINASLPPVEILINNAGITHFGLLSDMQDTDWEKVMSTNLDSLFYCSRAVIPDMVREKKGRIINICSVWGERGASFETAYSASKGGMIGFTKALSKELAPSGIAVNAIAPGVVDTPMNSRLTQEDLNTLKEEIPAGRFAAPEEVAETALFLATAPVYLTGQIIGINGGWF